GFPVDTAECASPRRGCATPSSTPRRATTTSNNSCCRCRAYTCGRPASCSPVRVLQRNGLPRGHDVERIECTLDRAHEIHVLAVFLRERVELVPADAVIAGACDEPRARARRH